MSCMLFKAPYRWLLCRSLIPAVCYLLTTQVAAGIADAQTQKKDPTRSQDLSQLRRDELGKSTADARLSRSLRGGFSYAVVGQNLLPPLHPEFGGDPGPLVGIESGFSASLAWTR